MNRKIHGFALVSFLAALAGLVISFLLLKEDVLSTAHTLFEYFPNKYGVSPAATWSGAIVLGLFTSIVQVVSASMMFSKEFSKANRILASFAFLVSCPFDNWTDIVFRSGNLTGDLKVATISTMAFYTLGSELLQGMSWLVALALWRRAISDAMWGLARIKAGWKSIGSEWISFDRAAQRKEKEERGIEVPSNYDTPYRHSTSPNPNGYAPKGVQNNRSNPNTRPISGDVLSRIGNNAPAKHQTGISSDYFDKSKKIT